MAMFKYTIPHIPPSINNYIGRTNVFEYQREKVTWKEYCMAYCRPKPQKPPKKVMVKLSFYFKDNRRHDADNYQKFIMDGLVTARVIQDDDFAHCTTFCEGFVDKNNPRTEIEITEV